MSRSPSASLFVDTVTLRRRSSGDTYVGEGYDSAETLPARVAWRSQDVRTATGDIVQSNSSVFLLGDVSIDYEDEIELPDGRTPPIVDIRSQRGNSSEVVYTEVLF